MNRGLIHLRAWVACATVAALAACGGGGSAGNGGGAVIVDADGNASTDRSGYPALTVVHNPATATLDASNVNQAAGYAHVSTKTLNGLIQTALGAAQDVSVAKPTYGYACSGGSVQVRYVDADGNGRTSLSDRIEMVSTTCPASAMRNGTLTMVISRIDGNAVTGLDLTFQGAEFGILAYSYGITPMVDGRFQLRDSRSDNLLVTNAGAVALTLKPGLQQMSLANVNLEYVGASLPTLAATGGLDLVFASGPQAGKRWQLDIVGQIANVNSSYSNMPPAPGALLVKAAGNRSAKLYGANQGGQMVFKLDSDLDGDGTYENSGVVADTALYSAL